VASFGMLLRNSKHKGDASYAAVMEIAAGARGEDASGRRGEFLQLVKTAGELSGEKVGMAPAIWRPIERSFARSVGIGHPHVASAWQGFLVGLLAGTALVLVIAASAFLAGRAAVRTISFACAAPAKLKC